MYRTVDSEQFTVDSSKQVAIISCGALVHNALLAAHSLAEKGIGVIVVNSHTVKPLDEKTILSAACQSGAVVTVEEHQIAGGLGGAVAELLAREAPTPIEFIGVHDQFGQSGKPEELIAHYHLDAPSITEAAKKAAGRRN